MDKRNSICWILLISWIFLTRISLSQGGLKIDKHEQFSTHGFSVMAFHNEYYEGRRGAIELVLHGTRVASNGDIRLEPVPIPDMYDVPMPVFKKRHIHQKRNQILIDMEYPRLGFNYQITMTGMNNELHVSVSIEGEIADSLCGKLAFMLELFPGSYKGKSYFMDDKHGIFPTQFSGRRQFINNELEARAIVRGKKLSIAPEDHLLHFSIESKHGQLELVDGRASTNHKWYIIRSIISKPSNGPVVEWVISPRLDENWLPEPVVGFSQIGYHPEQPKLSVIEIHEKDKADSICLKKISAQGKVNTIKKDMPIVWGKYYRNQYLHFDFSDVQTEGMYYIEYGGKKTEVFPINENLYSNDFWYPSLETFVPVQMCHVGVKDRLRLWHGPCHLDDARQAPANVEHFDHYEIVDSIYTGYKDYEHIPGLNHGGWHDAGDVDIESTSNTSTLHDLCLIYEEFGPDIDQTHVDYNKNMVYLHEPDGKPDVLQQIVHGVRYILGNYRAFGFLSRGVICPDFQQYLQMGDAASQTDGFIYDPSLDENQAINLHSGKEDDRLIFTNKNAIQEYKAGIALAAASRCLKDFDPILADECLSIAHNIWENEKVSPSARKDHPYYKNYHDLLKKQMAIELFMCTSKETYKKEIIRDVELNDRLAVHFLWSVSRIFNQIDDQKFKQHCRKMLTDYSQDFHEILKQSPYSVPQIHNMFGTGFRFMNLAKYHYFLHKEFPDIIGKEYIYNVVAYMHGNHPVSNHSLISGIGAKSVTSAYGINRADFSYIPGGICAGPLLIKPDLLEFRVEDPFFWVQKEYVIYAATTYVFLMMATEEISMVTTQDSK